MSVKTACLYNLSEIYGCNENAEVGVSES